VVAYEIPKKKSLQPGDIRYLLSGFKKPHFMILRSHRCNHLP